MSNDMKIAATTVRRLREARAWSQEQLATVSGISPRTVQRVESEGIASLDTRMALAAALECEPAMLLESAVAESVTHAQPAAASLVQSPSSRSPYPWLPLAWLLFAIIAFQMVAGYKLGQDLAERDNRIECKSRAVANGSTCSIEAAEERGQVARAE
jgi:transcriptional regulator with XRE-family HTH domain